MIKPKQIIISTVLVIQFNLFFACLVHSQVNNYRPIKELQWRALTGEVYFIPFFINTPSGEFEEEEIAFYLTELAKSKEWIIEQSKNYPNVNLEITDDYINSYDEIIYLENVNDWNKGGNNSVVNNIVRHLNFENIKDYVSYHGINIERSKVIVLCFVKQIGRSHAYDFNSSIFSDDISIDHALVFCNTKYGTYTSYKVITHEILHLFRAWDLYGGEPQNETKAKKLKEMFPNSIMLNTYGTGVPNLDEINAWRIGWNLKPQDFYMEYEPQYIKNMKEMAKEKNSIKFDLKKKSDNIQEKKSQNSN